jgi:hypothetical protein
MSVQSDCYNKMTNEQKKSFDHHINELLVYNETTIENCFSFNCCLESEKLYNKNIWFGWELNQSIMYYLNDILDLNTKEYIIMNLEYGNVNKCKYTLLKHNKNTIHYSRKYKIEKIKERIKINLNHI